MALPEEASIIREDERDNFDQYTIDGGRIFCFEFKIGEGEEWVVEITHTKPDAQDLSLRCWFSDKPLGSQYFTDVDSLDVFSPGRVARQIPIGAIGTQSLYQMPTDKELYVMVQNMQNSTNFFELAFKRKT